MLLCPLTPPQGVGAVTGAAAEEASGGEGGAGPGEHGAVCGTEPPPDDGAHTHTHTHTHTELVTCLQTCFNT